MSVLQSASVAAFRPDSIGWCAKTGPRWSCEDSGECRILAAQMCQGQVRLTHATIVSTYFDGAFAPPEAWNSKLCTRNNSAVGAKSPWVLWSSLYWITYVFDKRTPPLLSQSSRASPSTILFALSGVIMLLLGALFFKPRKIATRSGFSEFLPPRAGGDFLQQRLTYQGSSGPRSSWRSYEIHMRWDVPFAPAGSLLCDAKHKGR